MKNKLYVGNLSYQMSESDLETAFGNYGTVQSARIITDRDTGRSKGFGFVEMENDDQAQECIENLDGKEVSGRNIRVNIAQDKRNNKPGRF